MRYHGVFYEDNSGHDSLTLHTIIRPSESPPPSYSEELIGRCWKKTCSGHDSLTLHTIIRPYEALTPSYSEELIGRCWKTTAAMTVVQPLQGAIPRSFPPNLQLDRSILGEFVGKFRNICI